MKKGKIFSAAAVAGLSALAGLAVYKMNKEKKSFTKEKWSSDVNKRYKMVDSLISEGGLVGKSRSDIIDLLGVNGLRSNTGDSIEYFLSPETDEEVKLLVLEFDENDVVIRCTACV